MRGRDNLCNVYWSNVLFKQYKIIVLENYKKFARFLNVCFYYVLVLNAMYFSNYL